MAAGLLKKGIRTMLATKWPVLSCLMIFAQINILGAEQKSNNDADTIKAFDMAKEEYDKSVHQLFEILKDPEIWKSDARRIILLSSLDVAKKLRAETLVPILVKHVAYIPPQREGIRARPLTQKCPVLRVLVEIGLPAVHLVLKEIKETEGIKETDEIDEKVVTELLKAANEDILNKPTILLLCLKEIYDKAGYGNAMAKKRLELELAATKDEKEKANLQAALAHPIFKEKPADTEKK